MPPTLTPPDLEAPARLRAVIGRLARRLRPTSTAIAAGLTPTRISVLLTIVRADRIRLSELAETEGINPTQLSRVIAFLLESGAVERSSDEGDRRAAWVTATAAGRRLAERIRRERTEAVDQALAGLAPADRRRIEEAVPALERLAEQLKGDRP